MNDLQKLQTCINALLIHKLRTCLTFVVIVLGVSMLVALLSFTRTFANNSIAYLLGKSNGVVMVEYEEKSVFERDHPVGVSNQMGMMYTFEQVEALSTLPLVRDVIIKNRDHDVFVGYLDSEIAQQSLETFGKNEQRIFLEKYQLVAGSLFSDLDFNVGTQTVLIHQDVAALFFTPVGNAVNQELIINGHIFLVKGVYDDKKVINSVAIKREKPFFIPYNSWVAYTGYEEIQTLGIVPLKANLLQETIRSVETTLNEDELTRGMYHVLQPDIFDAELQNLLGRLTLWCSFGALLTLLVGGTGVLNIMYASAIERAKEIGVCKALGASAKAIMVQFLLEAIVLTSIGGLLGSFIGSVVHVVVCHILAYDVMIYLDFFVFGIFYAIFLGFVFGIWPAKKAAHTRAVDVLQQL